MPREKLILICQAGGEFVMDDAGWLSYTGGEAHALDINHETLFDDLKLKVAEMFNLEYKSLSVKYFLPGNKQTLITLSNDKDLKRMFDFHKESVTADVFVMGREGFSLEVFGSPSTRAHGVKLAKTVTIPPTVRAIPAATAPATKQSKPVRVIPTATPTSGATDGVHVFSSDGLIDVNVTVQSSSRGGMTSKHSPAYAVTNVYRPDSFSPPDCVGIAANTTVQNSVKFDVSDTPADTVKKRRRTASWTFGANGPTIVPVTDDIEVKDKRKGKARKQNDQIHDVAIEADPAPLDISSWIDIDYYCSPGVSPKDILVQKMVASWKDGITGEGQEFKSVAEFRDALQKYAIAHRFVYRLKKNDTNRATGVCIVEGCSWMIRACWVPAEEVFRIRKMEKSHTCGGECWKAAHPAKSWLVNIIKERLRENPHQKPKEIANGLHQDFGIKLNYTQVWRGLEDAKQQLQCSYKEFYNQLPWLCDKLVEANPGSVAKLVTNSDSRFHHLFVSFHASIYGFQNGCRPLLFLDSTNVKSKYHEILLTATALDGDDGVFPVSFAIIDVENEDNWHWFLEQLRSLISTLRPITFVSDREKGLTKSIIEVFGNAHCGYSIYHLLEDFRRNLKGPFQGEGKSALPGLLLSAAHSVRLESFRMFTEQIKGISSKAYDWLMEIEPEYWTNAFFKGDHYNQITENVAESFNNWLDEVQDLPMVQKVEALRCKMMELMYKHQTDSSEWATKLTPSKEQKLQEEILKSFDLRVFVSSDTLFEVHDRDSVIVVDIEKSDCNCMRWKLTGIPCSHAIAVFSRKHWSAYDYCSRYFTADSFRLTYSKSINPVLETFQPQDEDKAASERARVLPPISPRPLDQPEEKRKKPQRELKRIMTCSRCRGEGHNKVTCKEIL
uniref:SWIM-type domain-containing protein n=1 Tax=Rhizophora mucronata TaxID=61149 RepID=A0A2P2MXP3_RHIMU